MGRLALVAGIFIIIVGCVDILVGWFPLGFGSPALVGIGLPAG